MGYFILFKIPTESRVGNWWFKANCTSARIVQVTVTKKQEKIMRTTKSKFNPRTPCGILGNDV